ncbi:hypothetical protein AB0953_06120 [Streptomyces sp. NPDC046866]|uniref:hypothetical protein n=1 Tax=Streptomyces sp. NPDC046866 TaxID=3154921 RepID=UPI003454107F
MEHEQTTAGLREDAGPAPAHAPDPDPPQPAARRRPGRRTLAVIAAGAALGVLAGTATGYAIQYGRKPTPLPPLAQQTLGRPAQPPADESTNLRSVNAYRWHKADEDLPKLLLTAPAGAKVDFNGSQPVDGFAADYYEKPQWGVGLSIRDGVRRTATVRWSEADRDVVEIRLLQFHERAGAVRFQNSHDHLSGKERAGNPGKDLPGVPSAFGHLWVDSAAHEVPGYHPVKEARVLVRRGDIVVDITWADTRGDIDESKVVDLAKRQLERL